LLVPILLRDNLDVSNSSAGDLTIGGGISDEVGSNGINKTGPGNLVLGGSASNTYTRGTTVSAGRLQGDGPLGRIGAATVAGGTLGGTGAVGAITGTIGTVRPGSAGNGPGILTSTSNSSLTSAAALSVQINGLTPGSTVNNYSQLQSQGNVDLGGATLTGAVGNGFVPAASEPVVDLTTTPRVIRRKFAEPFAANSVFINGLMFQVQYFDSSDPTNLNGANPTEVILTRVKANATVSVVSSAIPAVYGQHVLYTAIVTPEAGAG